MVRLSLLVSLVCLTGIALGLPTNDDLEIDLEHQHDHSHHHDHDHSHHHDSSDSSDSDSDETSDDTSDSSDESHDHDLDLSQGIDLTNGTCIEKAERLLKYLWQRYKARFGIKCSPELEAKRIAIFRGAVERIKVQNLRADLGEFTYQEGLTPLSCLAPEEFAKLNGFKVDHNRNSKNVFEATVDQSALPQTFNWAKIGGVTPVKNQGSCGSCYSFATTGVVEFQKWNLTKELVSASEENIVDCSRSYNNNGCNGGRVDWSLKYIQKNDGIDTEASYPYTGKPATCKYNPANKLKGIKVNGPVSIKRGDETALLQALVQTGPIAVAIDASQCGFQNYKSGVYKCPKKPQLNHAVLLVGYDKESYIIKNSWGTKWGEEGYVRISREKSSNCGVPDDATYACAAAAAA